MLPAVEYIFTTETCLYPEEHHGNATSGRASPRQLARRLRPAVWRVPRRPAHAANAGPVCRRPARTAPRRARLRATESINNPTQRAARVTLRDGSDLFGRAGGDEATAAGAPFGAEVDHPVGGS